MFKEKKRSSRWHPRLINHHLDWCRFIKEHLSGKSFSLECLMVLLSFRVFMCWWNKPGKIAWMMRSARWMALGTRCSGRLHETSRCATMLTTKSETVTATIRHSRSCSTTASMSHILCSSTLAIAATSCWPPKHPQLEFYQLLTTMRGGGGGGGGGPLPVEKEGWVGTKHHNKDCFCLFF